MSKTSMGQTINLKAFPPEILFLLLGLIFPAFCNFQIQSYQLRAKQAFKHMSLGDIPQTNRSTLSLTPVSPQLPHNPKYFQFILKVPMTQQLQHCSKV